MKPGRKHLEMLFSDVERLRWISQHVGSLQVIYGGKAHPRDQSGKDAIQHVYAVAAALRGSIPVVYERRSEPERFGRLVVGRLRPRGHRHWVSGHDTAADKVARNRYDRYRSICHRA